MWQFTRGYHGNNYYHCSMTYWNMIGILLEYYWTYWWDHGIRNFYRNFHHLSELLLLPPHSGCPQVTTRASARKAAKARDKDWISSRWRPQLTQLGSWWQLVWDPTKNGRFLDMSIYSLEIIRLLRYCFGVSWDVFIHLQYLHAHVLRYFEMFWVLKQIWPVL